MKKNIPENDIKICAVVCEYNPFHNGHLYQLRKIKEESDCDALLCLMSGNFVQRGEAAILEKHERAKHAVLAGADCVIELPPHFAIANAEVFASGAVKMLSAIPAVKKLAFGTESGTEADLLSLAALCENESPAFKNALKKALDNGESFARARFAAMKETYPQFDERLFLSPNNVLGLEYAKAIRRLHADIHILPIRRVGAEYRDETLRESYSSASAIRNALYGGMNGEKADPSQEPATPVCKSEQSAFLANNIPPYVAEDLAFALSRAGSDKLDAMEYYAAITRKKEELANVADCTEGLENALQNAAKENFTAERTVAAVTSRRYTAARLRRILLCATLGIFKRDTEELLRENAWYNVLAAGANANEILSALNKSGLTVLVRKGDEKALTGIKKHCYAVSLHADAIYAALCEKNTISAARFIKNR